MKKRKKIPAASDEGGFDFGGFDMPNMGNFFRGAYDTIADFTPPLPFFGSDDYDDNEKGDDEYDDDNEDTTKIRNPKLKHSLYSKHRKPPNSVFSDIQQKNSNRWYDKFFFGSDDETTTIAATTISTPLKTTTDSGFFSWFGGSSEEKTEQPVVTETTTKQSIYQIEK